MKQKVIGMLGKLKKIKEGKEINFLNSFNYIREREENVTFILIFFLLPLVVF